MIIVTKLQHVLERGLSVAPVIGQIHETIEEYETKHLEDIRKALPEIKRAAKLSGWAEEPGEFCGRPFKFPKDDDGDDEMPQGVTDIKLAYKLEPFSDKDFESLSKSYPAKARFIRVAVVLGETHALFSTDMLIHLP